MLQLKTVHKETFVLLKELMSQNILQGFTLAGGTALALQIGHRISVDLDFFTSSTFDSNELFENLRNLYKVSGGAPSVNSLSLFIKQRNDNIKIDLLRHNYPVLRPVRVIETIRISSLEDIAAMKLNAIVNRGAKKDFYDIHALLNYFSIRDLLGFFENKYKQQNSLIVLKSLVYFADADLEPRPISLVNVTWDEIKENIKKKVKTIF